ncbi:MAG: ParB/RepB/Spo0J family partition protein [Deltaproteobacteria bacterium]|nr:ParB/RepB/Spo0J family partition protein [Deltaproteobacteria bacterium]TLN03451.1 MAG: ParB/RepB/Spo0J family partition protein [bacterium]
MVKKTGLGRGMAALLEVVEDEGKNSGYFSCPIEEIKPNSEQPRKRFSIEKLEELAASIREKGIIQPLVVRKMQEHYELVAGERRWRAAQKAGLREVPVVIQDISDDAALEIALIENIQREDLNVIEQAEAFHSLIEKFHLSQEEMARRVGKDRSTVANSLRLLKLPNAIKNDILEERLSMGHARAILSLETSELMEQARQDILAKRLSVRETENLVKRLKTKRSVKPKALPAPEITAVVDSLKRRFMTKVAIRQSGKGGKVEISFSSLDELTRIIDILTP